MFEISVTDLIHVILKLIDSILIARCLLISFQYIQQNRERRQCSQFSDKIYGESILCSKYNKSNAANAAISHAIEYMCAINRYSNTYKYSYNFEYRGINNIKI